MLELFHVNCFCFTEQDYPPEANAGEDVLIHLPNNTVTLNGSKSRDDKVLEILAHGLRHNPNQHWIHWFKISSAKIGKMCGICFKLTIKISERCLGVFILNFEQILHIVLFFPLLNLDK